LPPWFGDLHTYVTNQMNNNEKKVKMKQKKNNKQKYMSKQLHRKTGIKDTNWKKKVIKWKLGIVKHKLTSVYAYLPHDVYNNS